MADIAGASDKQVAPDRKQNSATIDINKETLKSKIESINTRQGIDEALKTKVLSIYQAAQDNLTNNESNKARINDFNQALKQAPGKNKQLQKEIEQTLLKASKQKPEDFNSIATEELDQRLIIEKGKISVLDEQLKKIENELVIQQARPQVIRQELVAAKQDFEATQKKLELPTNKKDSKLIVEAELTQLKTLADSRSTELKMLDVEATSNPGRIEVLKSEFRLLDIKKNLLNTITLAIDNVLAERHQQEAIQMKAALSQAELELSGKHPLIQTLTRENIQKSRDLQLISDKIENYNAKKSQVDGQVNEIERQFKSAEKKINLAGLSPALGKILRKQRSNLDTQEQFTLQSETIQNETAITSLEQFNVEDKLNQLNDIDSGLQQIMAQNVDHNLPVDERMMIQAEVRVLLNIQKELLNKLAVEYTAYLQTLGDLDFAQQQMMVQANKFAAYLDENLLWVKSSDPVNTEFIGGLYKSIKWLLSPLNWISVVKDCFMIALNNPFLVFLGVISLALLLWAKKWSQKQLAVILVNVNKIYTDKFIYTLQVFLFTIILVLPIPLFTGYLGWLLSNSIHADEFTKAIGDGLKQAALPFFFLQFFYRVFADNGIAKKHFQWPKKNTQLLRQQISWLRFVAVLSTFIIYATTASKTSIHSDNLGRLALIISMLAQSFFWGRLLNPNKGLLNSFIKSHLDGLVNKSRYLWYPTIICIPLVIIGFAISGYYLSALELQEQLIESLRLIFVLIIIHEVVVRWLTIVNRQLAIKNSQQIQKISALIENNSAASIEALAIGGDESPIDIPKINAQTIKLLNVFISLSLVIGLWMIWKNILPAFSFLDNIVLWQHLVTKDNQSVFQPVTLTNLLLAGLYLFVSVVSVRNFSGIMELLVFRHWSIEAGSRYAVNQLANYFLVTIGFISIANELGGSWSQVQWLVAALSVGLGFGLQEIFANLVSGIILLFERPIRVSDTVTIGTVTGKVSRIQMRATTLIDWDQKEHIVPNKTFITSQLVNWTLTNTITRIEITVGIAYGSDIELAHKVMLDTVLSMPLILSEPEPGVWLVGFGDNALTFSIRIFVSELADRLPVSHELYMRLEKALREHKIVIPFPQRDIHIHSVSHDVKQDILLNKP